MTGDLEARVKALEAMLSGDLDKETTIKSHMQLNAELKDMKIGKESLEDVIKRLIVTVRKQEEELKAKDERIKELEELFK